MRRAGLGISFDKNGRHLRAQNVEPKYAFNEGSRKAPTALYIRHHGN